MKTNFKDFINTKKSVNDSINISKIEKIIKIVNSILLKHIKYLMPFCEYTFTKEDNIDLISFYYIVGYENSSMFSINFDKRTNEVYSISFYKTLDLLWTGKAKSDLTLYTLGSSIVYFMPIIWTIASKQNYNISKEEAIKLGRNIYEAYELDYYIGKQKYNFIFNLDNNDINYIFYESKNLSDELKKFKKSKRAEALLANAKRNESPEAKELNKKLWAEYNEILNAINNGATNLEELKIALSHNVKIAEQINSEQQKLENKFNIKKESPSLIFKKMAGYISMVIRGINPSLIICGAPGIGKTYRVKKQLTDAGYKEGYNMLTIKGKCTPRALYTALYNYKDEGNIIVIDDADGLVGPKAPEDSINILKGALDSDKSPEGRLVTYGIAGKLVDDEGLPIPKRFYYKGGVIVITNYNAGSLDSALRGRSYIQDIDFTNEEILEIIKELIPAIDPLHLSIKSKMKAYNYLTELVEAKEDAEISIRTFGICAGIFESCNEETGFTDLEIKSMIKEQMKLQAQRIKLKY